MKFRKHVFICTNQREPGRECCGEATGMALVQAFREEIRRRGLHVEVRAQRAGCVDACSYGPAVVVYPDGTYYGHVKPTDAAEIVESHLINHQPVEKLRIAF